MSLNLVKVLTRVYCIGSLFSEGLYEVLFGCTDLGLI